MEANQNNKWVCPPCRGICNCSRCRRGKGWMPTGHIYSKVSVAQHCCLDRILKLIWLAICLYHKMEPRMTLNLEIHTLMNHYNSYIFLSL